MEKHILVVSLICGLVGTSSFPEEFLEEALSKNGDPVSRLAGRVAMMKRAPDLSETGTRQLVKDFRRLLSPLHPVLCFLREQRRERVQRAFEDLEAHADRHVPPAGPEMPVFFVSRDEVDDAVYPEEVEEARRRRLRRIRAASRRRQQ